MNIYLLTQNTCHGYDTYDSCVVIAKNRDDASTIHPSALEGGRRIGYVDSDDWPSDPKHVTVELLGPELGGSDQLSRVICASFNAG